MSPTRRFSFPFNATRGATQSAQRQYHSDNAYTNWKTLFSLAVAKERIIMMVAATVFIGFEKTGEGMGRV